jgi:hypothetical protein
MVEHLNRIRELHGSHISDRVPAMASLSAASLGPSRPRQANHFESAIPKLSIIFG